MSASVSRDRVLVLLASAWMAALLVVSELTHVGVAFFATLGLIAAGVGVSFHVLTHTRRVLVILNCTLIGLYGFLNYQLYRTFGGQRSEERRVGKECRSR